MHTHTVTHDTVIQCYSHIKSLEFKVVNLFEMYYIKYNIYTSGTIYFMNVLVID